MLALLPWKGLAKAGHCAKHFISTNSFTLQDSYYYYPYFVDEVMEARRGEVTCSSSHTRKCRARTRADSPHPIACSTHLTWLGAL